MILVLPATNRRKNPSFRIYSASPTTFLEWICPQLAYVSRSTSRHLQDFARFGLLYLRGGFWENRQILSKDWIDYGRTPSFKDESQCYGAHWWINSNNLTQFYASGFEGQTLLLDPSKDVIVLRLGRTSDLEAASLRSTLYDLVDSL